MSPLTRRRLLHAGSLIGCSLSAAAATAAPASGTRNEADPILVAAGNNAGPDAANSATPGFQSVRTLQAADWLSTGEVALIWGWGRPGDGGGGLWLVTEEGSDRDPCCVALANGKFAWLAHQTRHDVRQIGIFEDTPGAEVAARLLALTHHMVRGGGGIIEMTQSIGCDNVEFPEIPEEARITYEMQAGARITPTNPQPGVFMWTFAKGENNTYPSFKNIKVWGRRPNRLRCNGILIQPTNQMTIDNCSAHWIEGCAWQIEGANNSRIDITTYKCGTEDGVYAQNFTGNLAKGNTCNDLVLQGTTEQDLFGINIEGSVIIRDGSSLKLHGGPQTLRALRLHRCGSFALRVYASQSWNREGFILISDAENEAREVMVVDRHKAQHTTRGKLVIDTMFNIKWAGEGSAAWCVLDLQSPGSFVSLEGLINKQLKPRKQGGRYHHFRIVGPGVKRVTYDLSGLRFANDAKPSRRLLDDRKPVRRRNSRALTADALPGPLTRTDADVENGKVDLRGASFVDIDLEAPAEVRAFNMDIDQQCTICAPNGNLTVVSSDAMHLSNSADFQMAPGSTLTLRRAGSKRFVEISRSATE